MTQPTSKPMSIEKVTEVRDYWKSECASAKANCNLGLFVFCKEKLDNANAVLQLREATR